MAKRKGHKSAKRGKKRALKTKGIKAKTEPLTLGEFRSVLQKVKSLGLAWTAEFPPRLVAEKPDAEAVLLSHEALKLQRAYPNFPEELGVVTLYILTGKKTLTIAGNQQLLEKKAAAVRGTALISDKYRTEFFFKHAIKVPYFSDLDWEVVVKAYEKNVEEMPRIAYALLSLTFDDPSRRQSPGGSSRTLTVAVDEHLAEKLIESLSEVKLALEKSRRVTNILDKQAKRKEKSNATTAVPGQLGQVQAPSGQSSKP